MASDAVFLWALGAAATATRQPEPVQVVGKIQTQKKKKILKI
jgi:hypothetical protein